MILLMILMQILQCLFVPCIPISVFQNPSSSLISFIYAYVWITLRKKAMRRILTYTITLMMLCITAGKLSAAPRELRITDGDNSITLAFDSEPTVTFSQTALVVTAGESTLEYPLTSTVTFDFVDASSVKSVTSSDVHFSFSSSSINVEGLAAGETVAVYTYGGMMVAKAVADNSGSCTIDADTLPRQPLIVKTSKTAYKIILR